MTEYLNQLLADGASVLVEENFTGVRADWWWERRLGGGIAVCQKLDPKAMSREISGRTGREPREVERAVEDELGLEDSEPVVLTFEVGGEVAVAEAARLLAERSAAPEGLAAGIYHRIEKLVG
jgi:hypothetical protein